MNVALNLGPTACCGELWQPEFSGKTYTYDNRRFCVALDCVMEEAHGYGNWQDASEADTEALRTVVRTDAEIKRNRRVMSLALSKGNAALEFVYAMSMDYEDGPPDLEEFEECPGIQFGQAGHNSSHSFYAGASEDGRKFVASMDVEEYCQGDKAKGLHCREVQSWDEVGYWGHY